MDVVDLSRWQFGITTVYHFILVPLTIGLAPMIAVMQTVWVKTGNEAWLRATKFFGKVFLINFALGVATGIVQEFQFGMNWSQYSRFVADVFGAPLAMEGLVAFFLESTFLGLWFFGWKRLPKWAHLTSIWLVAIGVTASAYFIIAANSFMQHPVGVEWNETLARPQMNNFVAVITNNTTLVAFPHVILGAWLTAATVVAVVCLYWMARNTLRAKQLDAGDAPVTTAPSQLRDGVDATGEELLEENRKLWRPVALFALWMTIFSGIGLFITGDMQAQLMFKQQPMKMAAAESLCTTETGAGFSVLSIGRQNNCAHIDHVITIPNMLSFLADHHFDSKVQGVDELQEQYREALNMPHQNFAPNLFVTYWSFRAMITWALGSVVVALGGLWLLRKKRPGGGIEVSRRFGILCLWMLPTPFLANASGWIFTEMGRQPWVVAPNWADPDQADPYKIHMLVKDGVSFNGSGLVWTSLIIFTLLYAALGVAWFVLERRYILEGPAAPGAEDAESTDDGDGDEPLSFQY
ncbi:cytochrome ubiquinol oxidase subunit I [Gordonia sp. PP30]|uniref:cytochrome ubiquinol oxidase subunit I n=1 Tax=Gordonia sp. PP30 TaxID=2935861 RepID=UPI001FFE96C5|nr:cytochrome ubiquinol oxidase subunit I [Gordonia sp. PP30]UQE75714.1 cytochrome ubiquinol oxidase subunit I [Gordonia sp. PP30]